MSSSKAEFGDSIERLDDELNKLEKAFAQYQRIKSFPFEEEFPTSWVLEIQIMLRLARLETTSVFLKRCVFVAVDMYNQFLNEAVSSEDVASRFLFLQKIIILVSSDGSDLIGAKLYLLNFVKSSFIIKLVGMHTIYGVTFDESPVWRDLAIDFLTITNNWIENNTTCNLFEDTPSKYILVFLVSKFVLLPELPEKLVQDTMLFMLGWLTTLYARENTQENIVIERRDRAFSALCNAALEIVSKYNLMEEYEQKDDYSYLQISLLFLVFLRQRNQPRVPKEKRDFYVENFEKPLLAHMDKYSEEMWIFSLLNLLKSDFIFTSIPTWNKYLEQVIPHLELEASKKGYGSFLQLKSLFGWDDASSACNLGKEIEKTFLFHQKYQLLLFAKEKPSQRTNYLLEVDPAQSGEIGFFNHCSVLYSKLQFNNTPLVQQTFYFLHEYLKSNKNLFSNALVLREILLQNLSLILKDFNITDGKKTQWFKAQPNEGLIGLLNYRLRCNLYQEETDRALESMSGLSVLGITMQMALSQEKPSNVCWKNELASLPFGTHFSSKIDLVILYLRILAFYDVRYEGKEYEIFRALISYCKSGEFKLQMTSYDQEPIVNFFYRCYFFNENEKTLRYSYYSVLIEHMNISSEDKAMLDGIYNSVLHRGSLASQTAENCILIPKVSITFDEDSEIFDEDSDMEFYAIESESDVEAKYLLDRLNLFLKPVIVPEFVVSRAFITEFSQDLISMPGLDVSKVIIFFSGLLLMKKGELASSILLFCCDKKLQDAVKVEKLTPNALYSLVQAKDVVLSINNVSGKAIFKKWVNKANAELESRLKCAKEEITEVFLGARKSFLEFGTEIEFTEKDVDTALASYKLPDAYKETNIQPLFESLAPNYRELEKQKSEVGKKGKQAEKGKQGKQGKPTNLPKKTAAPRQNASTSSAPVSSTGDLEALSIDEVSEFCLRDTEELIFKIGKLSSAERERFLILAQAVVERFVLLKLQFVYNTLSPAMPQTQADFFKKDILFIFNYLDKRELSELAPFNLTALSEQDNAYIFIQAGLVCIDNNWMLIEDKRLDMVDEAEFLQALLKHYYTIKPEPRTFVRDLLQARLWEFINDSLDATYKNGFLLNKTMYYSSLDAFEKINKVVTEMGSKVWLFGGTILDFISANISLNLDIDVILEVGDYLEENTNFLFGVAKKYEMDVISLPVEGEIFRLSCPLHGIQIDVHCCDNVNSALNHFREEPACESHTLLFMRPNKIDGDLFAGDLDKFLACVRYREANYPNISKLIYSSTLQKIQTLARIVKSIGKGLSIPDKTITAVQDAFKDFSVPEDTSYSDFRCMTVKLDKICKAKIPEWITTIAEQVNQHLKQQDTTLEVNLLRSKGMFCGSETSGKVSGQPSKIVEFTP